MNGEILTLSSFSCLLVLSGFYSADLPWPDFSRKKVGNPSKTTTDAISIRFIVIELTPSSEEANAKVI